MSFAAMPAWQALLLVVGAAAVAAWLFLMKVRPPRVEVPTLLLWQRVFDHVRELTWWERVRRAVSLAVAIALAVALALAVTRPGPGRGPESAGRTLIVLDSSWSMAARTSSGETRWQRAVRQARALAAASSGDVALATTAEGLIEGPTQDLALIETAIDRLAPAGADLAAWPKVPGADQVHFITDGSIERRLPSGVTVHSVFEAAPNVAVVAFGARPSLGGDSSGEAFVQVANFADQGQRVRVVVSRGSDVLFDQSVEMAAGEAVSQIVPVSASGSARLVARVEAAADALTEDNEAVAWLDGTEPVDVLLVSDDPGPLGALFRQDPSLKVSAVRTADYKAPESGIVVFDRWLPAEPPGRPALCIAPPAAPWLGQPGAEERAARWLQPSTHPAVAGVDPLTIELKRVRAYAGDGLDVVARSEHDTPLVSVADEAARRLVVWSFSPSESNLEFAPAFPVLVGDAVEWLARPSYGVLRHPGPVRLPATTGRVVSPTGQPVPFVRTGTGAFVRLNDPGLYLVDAGGSRGVVGVNVGEPAVSNLLRTSASGAAQVASGGAGWPWWMWLVVVAFLLASAEWWTWQRRVTV